MKKITLKYGRKSYLATLALFLCCLTGSIGAVFSLGQRQNFSSTVNEALAQQQYLMQSLGTGCPGCGFLPPGGAAQSV